ncbi:hypothetical protein GCM10007084_03940 [Parabacteroides faecis]|jgi:hypothetical protein|uniref:Virulence protein n=1 Tax=Parabacteroides faecis TaxID=1217282 RepID=A0ABR6KK91_9BACT|nr:hypothetical protein [Parabacteroides faecis]GGJ83425.1 hypothetical protein GCM10007084_03940 [Parabacteroides faecis]
MESKDEIIIYQSQSALRLEVRLQNETVWLTQAQIAELFGTKRQAITKHLQNIFNSGELDKNSVSSKVELTAQDGKNYVTKIYNLDAIISVGYRVNSKNATAFRQWATQVLRSYLLKGYSINQRMDRMEVS